MIKVPRIIKLFSQDFENTIFPQFCINCESHLHNNEIVVCKNCLTGLVPTQLVNWADELTTGSHLDCALSAFWFDELLQNLVHKIKYNNYRKITKALVGAMVRVLESELSKLNIDALIPVPLHSVKFRERGFNQADSIAEELSLLLKVPVKYKTIKRCRWTVSQTSLDIETRRNNMDDAFIIKKKLDYSRILLIDDVLTTGATSNSCAKILKENGADWVGVMTIGTPR